MPGILGKLAHWPVDNRPAGFQFQIVTVFRQPGGTLRPYLPDLL